MPLFIQESERENIYSLKAQGSSSYLIFTFYNMDTYYAWTLWRWTPDLFEQDWTPFSPTMPGRLIKGILKNLRKSKEPLETLRNLKEPQETIRNPKEPLQILWNPKEPQEIPGALKNSLRTQQNPN